MLKNKYQFFTVNFSIINRGLFFTSRYIFPIYSPIMPRERIMTPEKNIIGTKVEAQPFMFCPEITVYNTHISNIMLIKVVRIPIRNIIFNGVVEKEVMACYAKDNCLRKGYLVFPVRRCLRS